MAQGVVSASTFEFDPINLPSLSISQASFSPITNVSTVKFGKDDGTTSADLVLAGTIDLAGGTSINTLSLKTTGGVTQQDSYASAYDAALAVNNLYAQGGTVSLAGGPNRNGNNVANLRGGTTSGNFEFYNRDSVNIGFSDPHISAGAAGISASGKVSLNSGGGVAQSASSPLILPGAWVNAGGNVILTDPGNRIDGRIDISTASTGPINLNNASSLTRLGNISGAWFYGYGAGDVNVLGTVAAISGSSAIHIEAGAIGYGCLVLAAAT